MRSKAPELWFHWAPTGRRKSIQRSGLLPGQWSRDRLWRPPYVCLAPWPSLGWGLSGGMGNAGDADAGSWDLWQVWLDDYPYEELTDDRDGSVKEARVYQRIFKRDVWYVASRVL